MQKFYTLKEIDCAVCAAKAERLVQKIKGIKTANIDFMTGTLVVEADEITEELFLEIKRAISKVEPDCEVI